MTLPSTRPRTYVDGTPVIPDDLNMLFDANIGMKHPDLEYQHHGASWLNEGATATYNGSIWTPAAGGGTFLSPIFAPAGSRITSCTFGYLRAGAGVVTFDLIRKPLNGGAFVVVATDSDNFSVALTTLTIAAINHVMLAGNGYALYMSFDAAASAAGSALVGGSHSRDRL